MAGAAGGPIPTSCFRLSRSGPLAGSLVARLSVQARLAARPAPLPPPLRRRRRGLPGAPSAPARALHSSGGTAGAAGESRSAGRSSEGTPVRVRFAPSPTGSLHLGGLRTALYNYLYAKQHGGRFVLRIEDTDRTRLVPGSEEELCRILHWAGVTPDEGPQSGGEYGPYRQSERLELYHRHATDLLASGAAYRCFCSAERLSQLRSRNGVDARYDRKCRHLDPEESERKVAEGKQFVIRLKAQDKGKTSWSDIVRGTMTQPNFVVDDGIILKSDGFPTYHLANVVDDHLMRITHVLRGEEWIASTAKHLMLYSAFGWSPPKFAHLPLLVNRDGTKLSKRSGDVHVKLYEDRGYLPSALVNFVALLGWNPGHCEDVMTIGDLTRTFSLAKVNKDAAIGNLENLARMNKIHMQREWQTQEGRARILAEVRGRLRCQYAGRISDDHYADEYVTRVVNLMIKERATTLEDVVTLHPEFFVDVDFSTPAALKIRETLGPQTIELVLEEVIQELKSLDSDKSRGLFDDLGRAQEVLARLNKRAQLAPLKTKTVMMALRWALMGQKQGPSIGECLHILGYQGALRRLEFAVESCRGLEKPSQTVATVAVA